MTLVPVELIKITLLDFIFYEVLGFERLVAVLACSPFKVWAEVHCPVTVVRPCVVN